MMQELTQDELRAIQGVAKVFIMSPSADTPYRPLTEEQLCARIDQSLAHARRGQVQDVEDADIELMSEFGLT